MGSLAGARPKLALQITDTLKNLIYFPRAEVAGPTLLDKRLCSALLKNSHVMGPLAQFVLSNASEVPASDLEFVGIRSMPMLYNICLSGGVQTQLAIQASDSMLPGR